MMSLKILLSGMPGSGKSTVVQNVIKSLKERGCKVGGIITPEIRKDGRRIGFKVVDVYSGKEGTLASIGFKSKYRVSKYGINLQDFERIALPALDFARKNCDLTIVDEIGRMELFSEKFKEKVHEILISDKPVLAVVHRNFIHYYEKYGKLLWVNREKIEKITKELIEKFRGA
jgi:nucleoside-triphosphatase